MGNQEPSVRIVPNFKTSDGKDAQAVLSVGGVHLDPWQADVLDDWFGRGPSGRWAAPTCGGSVPRQNGKSLLVQGRAAAGMILFNEQVIYTAHLQKTATETFEEMRDYFESKNIKKYVADIKSAIGREQIILKSGARIKFLARTRNGGRGQHADLLIVDEAQEIDENQQASFLPALAASLNPQTIYVGTPPDSMAMGTVFRKLRGSALAGETKKTAWFEYSVDEVGDVNDKQRWADTNPALGRRILVSSIEGEVEQMDSAAFARERLGWWMPITEEQLDHPISESVWDFCKSDDQKPEGKEAYGIKFAPDGSMVYLCGAVIPKTGPARISMIESRPTAYGTQWLADWLNERYKKASCVVIDGRNGVDVLIDKIRTTWIAKNSVVRPTANDVVASVGTLSDSLNEQTVTWYGKQDELRESALSSVKRPIGGGWGFGGDNSGPIEACALALWGARTSKRDPSRQMRIG